MNTRREGGLQLFLLRRLRQERRQRACWVRPILIRRDKTGDVATQNLSRSNTVCILQVHSPNRHILPPTPLATLPATAAPSHQCRLSCTYNCSRVKLRRAPPLRATAHNTHRQAAKMPTSAVCDSSHTLNAISLLPQNISCMSFQAENHLSIQTFGLNHDFVLSFYCFFISVFRFLASRFLVFSCY